MKTIKGVLIALLSVFLCLGLSGSGIAAGGYGQGQGGQSQGQGGQSQDQGGQSYGQYGVNGQGGGNALNHGNGAGTCISQLVSDEPLDMITGHVADVGLFGQGIAIDTDIDPDTDTDDGVVRVYGIGPVRYWEEILGIPRPDVGEKITVYGREITFSDGTTKFIAFIVLIGVDENEIVLRDETTGQPLWRNGFFAEQYRHEYDWQWQHRNQNIEDDDPGL